MDTDTATRSLLDVVAPASWAQPPQPPTAHAPNPLQALRASLRLTLQRDLASITLDSETTEVVINTVLHAITPVLTNALTLEDATAACLLTERVTLATALALETLRQPDPLDVPLPPHD